MPEIAEIEVVFRQLKTKLQNKEIVYSNSYANAFPYPYTGHVTNFWRHGKWLHLKFRDGVVMRINFGMSGRIELGKIKHKHLKWKFKTEDETFNYIDPRGFGHLQIVKGKNAILASEKNGPNFGNDFLNLGPDVLSVFMTREPNTQLKAVWKTILNSKQALKDVLMNQSRVAGIGNIYSNELCWMIRLHPETPANKLNSLDIDRLIRASNRLFKAAVSAGGTSFGDANTFKSTAGYEGNYFKYLRVYGQDGRKCSCGNKIKKYNLKGRSTFFCTKCQPYKELKHESKKRT